MDFIFSMAMLKQGILEVFDWLQQSTSMPKERTISPHKQTLSIGTYHVLNYFRCCINTNDNLLEYSFVYLQDTRMVKSYLTREYVNLNIAYFFT